MRQFLTQKFKDPAHDIVFYLHDDSYDVRGQRRAWLNGKEIQEKLEKEENVKNIKIVHGFYGLFDAFCFPELPLDSALFPDLQTFPKCFANVFERFFEIVHCTCI